MKVLITGASGFVGQALATRLQDRFELTLLAGPRGVPPQALAHLNWLRRDLLRADDLVEIASGHEGIVHAAGLAHVRRNSSSDEWNRFYAGNVLTTKRMATAAAAAGVRRFVLMSSGAINGIKGLGRPFVETDLPDPASHYGRSKQEAEEVLQQVCAGSDLQYVCLRPPVLVGAGSPGNIAAVLKAITTGLPLPLAGIDNRRSYLGIGNLCDLVALALTHPGAANQVFMATDEPSLSTEALVRMLARHLGRSPRLFPVPLAAIKAVAALTGRTASLRPLWASLELDASKAVRQLGWRRQQSLESAMAEAAAALRLDQGRGTREPGASKEGSGRQTIGAGRENS